MFYLCTFLIATLAAESLSSSEFEEFFSDDTYDADKEFDEIIDEILFCYILVVKYFYKLRPLTVYIL